MINLGMIIKLLNYFKALTWEDLEYTIQNIIITQRSWGLELRPQATGLRKMKNLKSTARKLPNGTSGTSRRFVIHM